MDPLKNVLSGILNGLQAPEAQVRSKLIQTWAEVAGAKVAAHTKPTLSENGELRVWVDQPALAYELSQKYKKTILKRAQAALGVKAVKSVRFFVGQLR